MRSSTTWVRKQHWWDIPCPEIPYTVTELRSYHQWVILNDWYSTVWIHVAVNNLKSSKWSPGISVSETTEFFKFLFCFKNMSMIKLLVSRNPLRNSIYYIYAYICASLTWSKYIWRKMSIHSWTWLNNIKCFKYLLLAKFI